MGFAQLNKLRVHCALTVTMNFVFFVLTRKKLLIYNLQIKYQY